MREPRPASVLDFAIAASLAVLPVLLLVLLSMRTLVPAERRIAGDAHVSVRRIAALKTFEQAIVRRDLAREPLPDAQSLLVHMPECATEWDRQPTLLERAAKMLGRPSPGAPTVAKRVAAQLGEIDAALARMSAEANRRVAEPIGFDVGRWTEAARRALHTPAEAAQYPGQTFSVRCADLASAVAALARGNGRMLATFAWRGTEVERAVERWRADQYVEISPRLLARANPWRGLPGCTYLFATRDAAGVAPAFFVKANRSVNERVCAQPDVYEAIANERAADAPLAIAGEPAADMSSDDPRWQVPPSLHTLLQPLETLQRASGALYRALADAADPAEARGIAPNRAALGGLDVDVGFSVDLTIDPALQALAQKTAACYTGRQDACRALAIRRAEDTGDDIGHLLLEHAMVRMAAVAIIDVPSGRIEALAGALSPCTVQEYDGPGRAASCDARLPYPIRYRPDALLNPAVFHDAMPASVIKPVMAAAFLSNRGVGARWLASEREAMRSASPPSSGSLRGQLMHSNSARFLDRMFCADRGFAPCERPWEIEAMTSAFGWNGACATPSERCGKRDLLFGRGAASARDAAPLAAPVEWVPYGRLLVEPLGGKPQAPFHARAAIALDAARIKRCAAGADGRRGSKDDWSKCRGGVVVDVVAEGWGQGHARATALGAAGMMAALAAAANGARDVHEPHLVRSIRRVADGERSAFEQAIARWSSAGTRPNALSQPAAQVIVSGLSFSHRYGTARLACEQVFDAKACRTIDWIAGKTGTPTFPNDDRTLDELAKLCKSQPLGKSEQAACGALRPYKWYVAAYRSDPASPLWNKAIGVLTERNWLALSGRIHGAGDHGPNPAAEIAMQIIGRQAGVPQRPAS